MATVFAMSEHVEANPWQGFLWLARRECHRVLRLWTQTTLAPVVSSLLFIVVFGLSLGGRIKQVQGFDYDEFIVPGLVAMAMAQAAYSNNASTIFQGRNDRFIDDVLAAPIHHWQVNVGYLIGGAFRALIIGVGLAALAVPITGAPIDQPAALVIAVLLLVVGFGALGTIVGIYAETFDHTSFINNIVILPSPSSAASSTPSAASDHPGSSSPTSTRSSMSWKRSATDSSAPRTSAPGSPLRWSQRCVWRCWPGASGCFRVAGS